MTAVLDRLLPKYEVTDDCWLWTAAIDKQGYGRLKVGGHKGQVLYAHRVAYELAVGPIPDGLHIDHLCRTRSCVNPDHLEPVTCRENLLRGNTIPAMRAARTHCLRGHEYTEENTIRSLKNQRSCRRCKNERRRVNPVSP